jgi:hypothetical protein
LKLTFCEKKNMYRRAMELERSLSKDRSEVIIPDRTVTTPVGPNRNPLGSDKSFRMAATQSQQGIDLRMKPMMRKKDGSRTAFNPAVHNRDS